MEYKLSHFFKYENEDAYYVGKEMEIRGINTIMKTNGIEPDSGDAVTKEELQIIIEKLNKGKVKSSMYKLPKEMRDPLWGKPKPKLNVLKKNTSGNILFETPMDINLEVFSRYGQGLYAWAYRDSYINGTNKVKFGQYGTNALNGSTPQETIESYTGTTADSIIILWAIRFSDEQIQNIGTAYKVEQLVGPKLGQKSKHGKSTEVFETSIELIENNVNAILYPNSNNGFFNVIKETYRPRLRQEEAIKKFKDYCENNKALKTIDFLLGAIMRFGKNFTFLQMAKEVTKEKGNILLITGRPDVFDSLKADVNGHIDFDGWVYDELKDKKYNWTPSNKKRNVLAVSTQLLTNTKHKTTLIKYLRKFKWDIIGIDEADTTMLTELSSEILKQLPAKYNVWISGTPWKLLSTGKFKENNSYTYDYIQQQKDKTAGIDSRAISLDWYCMETHPIIKDQQKWYSDDEGFTLSKFWGFNEETNKFNHEADVVNFLKSVFGIIPNTKFSPYKIISNLKNTIWMLPPNTNAVIRLKYLIESLTDEYKIFAATGSETDDITDVKNFLKWNSDKKTIVLTITRFTRGTTVPEWDGAFVLNDTDSAELYFQFCFRPTTPMDGKEQGYVFDFNPNRTLIMLAEYARNTAIQKGITTPSEIIKEYLDNFNVFGIDGGVTWKRKSLDEVLNAIRDSDYNAKTLRSSGRDYINLDNKISDKLFEMIMELDKEKKGKLKIQIASASEYMKKGKNIKILSQSDKKRFTDTKNDIVNRIATLISRLPIISELGYSKVEDIIDNLPNELFYGATKSDIEVLKLLVKEKVIDTYKINLQLS